MLNKQKGVGLQVKFFCDFLCDLSQATHVLPKEITKLFPLASVEERISSSFLFESVFSLVNYRAESLMLPMLFGILEGEVILEC